MTIFSRNVTSLGGPLLLMAGCATAPIKPANPPPDTIAGLPTQFDANSRVGRFWADVQQQERNAGRDPSTLAHALDRGFHPFSILRLHVDPVNQPGLLETGEVMEYAYASPQLYPLLRKHGFNIPFSSDPDDPKTAAYRHFLQEVITKAQAQVPITPATPRDSDAYRIALSEKIYLGLSAVFNTIHQDCAQESEGWKAYQDQCGACTERSAILYEAFATAGLHPLLLKQNQMKLSITDNLKIALDSNPAGYHVLVGVPLANHKRIIADLALERFGIDDPHAWETTNGQYVMGTIINGFGNKNASETQLDESRRHLRELGFLDDATTLMLVEDRELLRLPHDQFEARIEERTKTQQPNILTDIVTEIMRLQNNALNHTPITTNALAEVFNNLKKTEPASAGIIAAYLTMQTLTIIEREHAELKRQGKSLGEIKRHFMPKIPFLLGVLKEGLELQPEDPVLWGAVNRLDPSIIPIEYTLAIVNHIRTLHPEHAFAAYIYALMIFTTADDSSNPDLAQRHGYEVLQRLRSRSTSAHDPFVNLLASRYETYIGTATQAAASAHMALEHMPKNDPFFAPQTTRTIGAAFRVQDTSLMSQAIDRLKTQAPQYWHNFLAESLMITFFPYYSGETKESPLPAPEVERRIQWLSEIVSQLERSGIDREFTSALRLFHALRILAFTPDGARTSKALFEHVSSTSSLRQQDVITSFCNGPLQRHINGMNPTANQVTTLFGVLKQIEPLVREEHRNVISTPSQLLARKALLLGHNQQGRELIAFIVKRDGDSGLESMVRGLFNDSSASRGEPTTLRHRLEAFKLLWEHRDHMTAEMRVQLHDQCHDLEFHFSNVRDIPHVVEARRLADQFESYRPLQRPTTR